MFELAMTAPRSDQHPAVFSEKLQDFTNFHRPSMPPLRCRCPTPALVAVIRQRNDSIRTEQVCGDRRMRFETFLKDRDVRE